MGDSPDVPPPGFPTTHWSVVVEAADPTHPDAQRALRALLDRYGPALYAHLRHPSWGLSADDAKDCLQDFCVHVLERPGFFAGVDGERGRFRHYIRGALKHFATDRRRAERAARRGGGRAHVPITFASADAFPELTAPADSPDQAFERSWALTVLHEAMTRLQVELEGSGKAAYYQVFRLALQGLAYRAIAVQVGIGETDVTNYLHRARRHFGRTLLQVVTPTVGSMEDAKAEVRDLMRALGRR